MNLTEYFNIQVEKGFLNKFVIILGSGFHKEAFPKEDNCLNSWQYLLNATSAKLGYTTNNYILDFELMISKKTRDQNQKNAHQIEFGLLKEICKIIHTFQNEVITRTNIKYPIGIFNPKYVSDVISLNFDLIPELLLGGKLSRTLTIENKTASGRNSFLSSRYRVVNKINFWHPHGDYKCPNSLILGIRKYGRNINEVENLRMRFKKQERNKSEPCKSSWFDNLMDKPIIVLGAGLSYDEWDLWYSLVNRLRNFSKKGNNHYQEPIFKMQSHENINTLVNDNFFYIDTDCTDNTAQWNLVDNLLNTKI